MITSDEDLRALFDRTKTIALVGASANTARPSNEVLHFLLERGFDVIPVNPGLAGKALYGQPVVASLADIDRPIDMVDVFRSLDQVPGVVDDAIAVGAKAVWTQLALYDEASAAKAKAAGLDIVMDRCPAIEIPRLQWTRQ